MSSYNDEIEINAELAELRAESAALTNNSMVRNVQRWYRLSKGCYDEQNRRCDQRCVSTITDFNWKYFKKGSYEGPNGKDFLHDSSWTGPSWADT